MFVLACPATDVNFPPMRILPSGCTASVFTAPFTSVWNETGVWACSVLVDAMPSIDKEAAMLVRGDRLLCDRFVSGVVFISVRSDTAWFGRQTETEVVTLCGRCSSKILRLEPLVACCVSEKQNMCRWENLQKRQGLVVVIPGFLREFQARTRYSRQGLSLCTNCCDMFIRVLDGAQNRIVLTRRRSTYTQLSRYRFPDYSKKERIGSGRLALQGMRRGTLPLAGSCRCGLQR
jgi:hypothetical protein